MHYFVIGVQVLSVGFAVLSAVLWFWSARIGPQIVPWYEPKRPRMDLRFPIPDSDGLIWEWNIERSGKVNAWAAICTGLSAILQTTVLLVAAGN
jgi:hypothetical protein